MARAGGLAVVVVLCVLLTSAVLRQIGARRLSALEEEIAERGDWATLEEFIDAVEIDPDTARRAIERDRRPLGVR